MQVWPSVTVIETLCDKVFGPSDTQVVEDADNGGENEEAVTDNPTFADDQMLMLGAYAPVCELETPKTCSIVGP